MSRASVRLTSPTKRQLAASWCLNAPAETVVEFRESKRTDAQNRHLWPLLTTLARKMEWPKGSGMKLSADDWKLLMMAGLNQEMRLVPNISMSGYVNLGSSSSKLTKDEFSQLIELIYAFAAQHEIDLDEGDDTPSPAEKERQNGT